MTSACRLPTTSIAAGYHNQQAGGLPASHTSLYSLQTHCAHSIPTSSYSSAASLRRPLVSPSVSLRHSRSAVVNAAVAAAPLMPGPQPLARASRRRESLAGHPSSLTSQLSSSSMNSGAVAAHTRATADLHSHSRSSTASCRAMLNTSGALAATATHGSSAMSTSTTPVHLVSGRSNNVTSSGECVGNADAGLLPPASAVLQSAHGTTPTDLMMLTASSSINSNSPADLRAGLATVTRSRRTTSTGSRGCAGGGDDRARTLTSSMSILSVAESHTLPVPQVLSHRRDSSAPPSSRRSISAAMSAVSGQSSILRTTDLLSTEPMLLRTPSTGPMHTRSASLTATSRLVSAPREGYGIAGLENLGNTCFMNSMLQCLGCVPGFVSAMLSGRVVPCAGGQVAPAYIEMLQAISNMTCTETFVPKRFRAKVRS
jgi:hypothetical protein